MKTLSLALRSLANRRTTALLTLSAIAVSVALLLGVQKLRTAARDSFANTVSGVDLIVGARSGQINLLLYSVFRVGDATANVSWETYQKVARRSDVAWTIPLSLGDSHRGYRVLGTDLDYFRHYRFAGGRELTFEGGKPFADLYDAVLGAEVAHLVAERARDLGAEHRVVEIGEGLARLEHERAAAGETVMAEVVEVGAEHAVTAVRVAERQRDGPCDIRAARDLL
ncbi:MAG: ABC transporter permease, partial [Gammaproteobacteria bacterium]